MIIRNVTVIDGQRAAPIADAEVVVTDGRFSAIRTAADARPAASGAFVFDARGGYLVPGLWESHTHLGGLASFKPENERAKYISELLTEFLSGGVTSVVDLGGPLETELAARDYRSRATDTAAGLFFAGPVFTGINGWPVLDDPERASIAYQTDNADTAYRRALELADQVDFIKCIYDGEPGAPDKLPLDALKAIVAAAHEKGRKVLVHVHERIDLEEAVASGADGIEHAFRPQDPRSTAEARDIAALLTETNTYYCPTLVTWEQIARNGEAGYLQTLVDDGFATPEDIPQITSRPIYGREFPRHSAQDARVRFDYAMRTLALMHDAGVKITAGSDVAMLMPSRPAALLRELQLLAKAGLPLPAVLAAGTRHSAEKIGQQTTTPGTITVGSVADALLLDADPYADIAHLVDRSHHVGTVRAGRPSWDENHPAS
ncbi:amidohydrolase family protein [Solihabitans fulvus]|uniref:amidohydrolase family protein n=1 Tax=Solihabitans fulvus TaxID=1892852 RepID=UPI001661D1FF|nr:amidohydrolase family protein [Solihabitans fulvus]